LKRNGVLKKLFPKVIPLVYAVDGDLSTLKGMGMSSFSTVKGRKINGNSG
jgi:hypothetical protein